MAYGYLKRVANEHNEIKDYLKEGMVFESFIVLIREAETIEELENLEIQIENEGTLKRSRLTEEEFVSLGYELMDYIRYLNLNL